MLNRPAGGDQADVWYPRLHLACEFIITVIVLVGAFWVADSPNVGTMADSGASAVVTLCVGYWFGRARS